MWTILLIVYLVGYLVAFLLVLRLWQFAKAKTSELLFVVLVSLGSWATLIICLGIGLETSKRHGVPFEVILKHLWTGKDE